MEYLGALGLNTVQSTCHKGVKGLSDWMLAFVCILQKTNDSN